jgi:AcrR family transcriptional regulator
MQGPIRPARAKPSARPRVEGYRVRLLEGFARAVTEKGLAAASVADIVRHARVSKRTFYEHFADKLACFLAVYAAASELTLSAIAAAAGTATGWEAQLDAAVRAYLATLQLRPALTRTCLLEIQAAGPKALQLRRKVQQAFADQMRAFVDTSRARHPEIRPLSPTMAAAIVGGINELVLLHVESRPSDRLLELADTAVELLRAVLVAPPPPRRRRRRPR